MKNSDNVTLQFKGAAKVMRKILKSFLRIKSYNKKIEYPLLIKATDESITLGRTGDSFLATHTLRDQSAFNTLVAGEILLAGSDIKHLAHCLKPSKTMHDFRACYTDEQDSRDGGFTVFANKQRLNLRVLTKFHVKYSSLTQHFDYSPPVGTSLSANKNDLASAIDAALVSADRWDAPGSSINPHVNRTVRFSCEKVGVVNLLSTDKFKATNAELDLPTTQTNSDFDFHLSVDALSFISSLLKQAPDGSKLPDVSIPSDSEKQAPDGSKLPDVSIPSDSEKQAPDSSKLPDVSIPSDSEKQAPDSSKLPDVSIPSDSEKQAPDGSKLPDVSIPSDSEKQAPDGSKLPDVSISFDSDFVQFSFDDWIIRAKIYKPPVVPAIKALFESAENSPESQSSTLIRVNLFGSPEFPAKDYLQNAFALCSAFFIETVPCDRCNVELIFVPDALIFSCGEPLFGNVKVPVEAEVIGVNDGESARCTVNLKRFQSLIDSCHKVNISLRLSKSGQLEIRNGTNKMVMTAGHLIVNSQSTTEHEPAPVNEHESTTEHEPESINAA